MGRMPSVPMEVWEKVMLKYEVKITFIYYNTKGVMYFRHGMYHRVGLPCGVWANRQVRYALYGKLEYESKIRNSKN